MTRIFLGARGSAWTVGDGIATAGPTPEPLALKSGRESANFSCLKLKESARRSPRLSEHVDKESSLSAPNYILIFRNTAAFHPRGTTRCALDRLPLSRIYPSL